MIYTEELTKIFDNRITAVDELNLEIPTGEIFGFLGPNGAGKTTTVRLLSCILQASKGEAVVAEYSIHDDPEQLRKNVGLLSENPSLYERLSARKNLDVIGRLYGLTKEQVNLRIIELAKLLDLHRYLDMKAGKLSKGNKHKVAIARAILHEPKVLFLDEPTASLDPEASLIVREIIEKFTNAYECTVFICTHNLPEAERLCDRVGIINKGSLATIGSPESLQKASSPLTTIEIELAHLKKDQLIRLQQIPGVEGLFSDLNSSKIVFQTSNPTETVPSVVREIVLQDGAILSVERKTKTLEDLYFEIVGRRND
ncbi:MAG: ABC transporter ATP-binding protein [Promethearchaeota archaeon]